MTDEPTMTDEPIMTDGIPLELAPTVRASNTASTAIVAPPRWLGHQRIDLEACSSTNDEAARLARAGARHGTIVIADTQTAGRGRDGRSWLSPRGGLYLSAVLRPPLPLRDVPPMTLAIGIALCDAARAVGAPCTLKWPNDVLVHGRKLAGVLIEAQSQGGRLDAVVIGIGVNLSADPSAAPSAASTAADGALSGSLHAITLDQAAGAAIDRETFIASVLAQVERWVDRYCSVGLPSIIAAWHERMAVGLAARATIDGAPLIGHIAGLDLDGALLLRDRDGRVHRVRSGDVEVIRQPGGELDVASDVASGPVPRH
jgi:BirA family biotin operon repressor/biotin-[acetyl-CoA-carboxylase] ligase